MAVAVALAEQQLEARQHVAMVLRALQEHWVVLAVGCCHVARVCRVVLVAAQRVLVGRLEQVARLAVQRLWARLLAAAALRVLQVVHAADCYRAVRAFRAARVAALWATAGRQVQAERRAALWLWARLHVAVAQWALLVVHAVDCCRVALIFRVVRVAVQRVPAERLAAQRLWARRRVVALLRVLQAQRVVHAAGCCHVAQVCRVHPLGGFQMQPAVAARWVGLRLASERPL